jgi:hypothetical protein
MGAYEASYWAARLRAESRDAEASRYQERAWGLGSVSNIR